MANEQTGSNVIEIDPKSSSAGGLSLQALENMLSDIRFQPKWREEAAKAADYYDGHQLTEERLARMERLGIPPLVTNLIAPSINAVLGMEAKARTDWRVTQENEEQEAPEMMMDAMNAKLNSAERESRADRAISDAYASQIKSGLGWVEVSRATDAMANPYRVEDVHRDEIHWDWRAKQPDLSDARYLIRKRVFDQDVLIAMMPKHKDLITWAVEDRFRTWQWDTTSHINTGLALAAHLERVTNIDTMEWRNSERRRATMFEVWYRAWKTGPVLRLPTGKVVPFNKNDMRQVQAVQAGMIRPQNATYSEVRVAFYMGCHRLYDMPSPYKHRHFPYVPFWGFREDGTGVPYGLIRAMMSPQDVVNSSDSKMHWMLNSRRLRADSNAIDTKYNSWTNVRESLARADSIILLDPTKPNARFREDNDTGLNAQQFQRRQQSAQDIESAGGVYRAMLGQSSNASSGIAINSLVEQGNTTMTEMNDNYQYARRQVGELLFSMVREDLMHEETPVLVKKEGKKTLVVLNQRTPQGIQNPVAEVPVKVVLEDVPSTPAFRAQQLQILTEATNGLSPEIKAAMVDMFIDMSDAPKKEEVIKRIRKITGIQADATPEQEAQAAQAAQAEQQQAKEMMLAKATAETGLIEARIKLLESQASQGDAAKLVKMVEAMYSAIQAGQVIASSPGVGPVADEVLKGAGYVPQSGGQDPNLSQPQQMPQELPQQMPQDPAQGMQPEAPMQQDGMMHGIESPGNDGIDQQMHQ